MMLSVPVSCMVLVPCCTFSRLHLEVMEGRVSLEHVGWEGTRQLVERQLTAASMHDMVGLDVTSGQLKSLHVTPDTRKENGRAQGAALTAGPAPGRQSYSATRRGWFQLAQH